MHAHGTIDIQLIKESIYRSPSYDFAHHYILHMNSGIATVPIQLQTHLLWLTDI